MKLYLSSQGFGNHLPALQQMVGSEKRVLLIDNAKDDWKESDRSVHVAEKKAEFEAAGFEFSELDLREYFRSPDTLKPIIDATPFVWVSGGNTFILRRAFAYSGLDALIEAPLKNGALVYGGSSAGAVLVTKTLRGTEEADDPHIVPRGYKEQIIWDGLGYTYMQIIPHSGQAWFSDREKAIVDYFETNGMKYETLKDGEVYVVDGTKEEKLT